MYIYIYVYVLSYVSLSLSLSLYIYIYIDICTGVDADIDAILSLHDITLYISTNTYSQYRINNRYAVFEVIGVYLHKY